MATTKEEFESAFKILSQFERQLIPAEEFGWEYITSRVKPSKPTLWRNQDFRDEFNRVKILVRAYKGGKAIYDLNASKESAKDAEINKLKRKIEDLEHQLSRERERLAYAAVVARRENIDPIKFEENSPLLGAIGRKKKYG
ncbi:hypothetical protein AB8613_09600 [Vibrio sp. BS-M-Sm-2]|uniref:hypothetical protein n=1 Tax=Vibrio sp. BS-M-Sm-2 TaxID=3241167 RepID=UPI0035562185